jgi:hypothetical protein
VFLLASLVIFILFGSPQNMSSNRQRQVKKGIDADEARRKREEFAIELRRNKREEQLQKRRAHANVAGQPAGSSCKFSVVK